MSFGERLRAARKRAGLSQTELAGTRCSVSYVSHLESGRRTPTAEILRYFETTLGLAPGSLGDASDMSGPGRRKAGEAEAVALYSEAVVSWRQGSFGLAYEQAHESRDHLPSPSRSDLTLLLGALLVEINIDLGHYSEALQEATAHLAAARAAGSSLLEARAGILSSKAARLDGQLEFAAATALEAERVCVASGLPATVRVTALVAAISARSPRTPDLVTELEQAIEGMTDSHTKGLGEWVLGTVRLRNGQTESGIAAHDRAGLTLSPTADFRNWSRFPRAAAEARLEAGVVTGVEDLLKEAQRRLELLDSADELASLTVVRSGLLRLQGSCDVALSEIEEALKDADLPVSTRARLHFSAAQILNSQGETGRATSVALVAAREFTQGGDVEQAQAAWALVDTIGAGDSH